MLNVGPKHADAERRRYDQAVMAQQAAACAVLGVMVGGGVSAVAWLAGEPALAGLALPMAAAVVAYQLYEFFRRYLFAHGRHAAGLWVDRSEEHTSELQSLMRISYAVFCLKIK